MKATIEYIEQKFDEYNALMFGGKLPRIPIEISNAKSFLGQCVFKKRRKLLGRTECYDFRLRINTRIDLPEQVVEDTIIHEMIHYYIGVNQIQDASAHGPVFRKIMNDINARYDRHITISHKLTKEQKEQAIDTRQRCRVVALVTMNDGKIGIKVVPRIMERILYYRKHLSAHEQVASVKFYLSVDPYFNRFPNSAALKVYFPPEDEIKTHLADSMPIELN